MSEASAVAATFGELLREHRSVAGYSQEALAERAGLSVGAIAALEQGLRRAPYRYTVDALAKALDLVGSALAQFEASAATARRRQKGATEESPLGNIPVRLTSFIGRETEMAELNALLRGHRLITVTGSGGVGKTRIATEIATQFVNDGRGEAWFVDLGPVSRGDHVAGAIRAAFRNSSEGLLILDNCEHVIDEAAAAALSMLRAAPDMRIVATSRERMAVEGEYVYRLSPLSAEAALELFQARAHASDVRIAFTSDERQMSAQICRHVENIPLAIELAATRVPTLGLDVLNARLKDYVTIPGGRDLPKRQRTINATISWSYDLLRAAEQTLLRRLSVFRGTFTLDAIEAVCASQDLPSEQIAGHLSQLVDKSLIEVQAETGTERRYRLLDSVRAFSAQKLAEAGESLATARAHAKRLAEIADSAFESYAVGPRHTWLSRFAPELDEVRAAVEWALRTGDAHDVVLAARIVGGLRPLWIDGRVLQPEGRWLAERVLEQFDEKAFPSIAASVFRLLIQTGEDTSSVIAAVERATPVFKLANDTTGLVGAQLELADAYSRSGDVQRADDALCRVFALLREEHLEQSPIHLNVRLKSAHHHLRWGKLDEARADLAERRRLRTLLGVTDHRQDRGWEAILAFRAGFPEQAIALFEQAIAFGRETGTSIYDVHESYQLAAVYLTLGEEITAASLARAALISRPVSIVANMAEQAIPIAQPIEILAAVAARSKQLATAAKLLGFTNARFEALERLRFNLDRTTHDVLTASLREQLSTEEIERYAAEGAQLDLSQAVDLALTVSF